MILWEIGSRTVPYEGAAPGAIHTCVTDGERADDLVDCPSGYMELVKRCWDQDPLRRPTAKGIVVEIARIVKNLKMKSGDMHIIPVRPSIN